MAEDQGMMAIGGEKIPAMAFRPSYEAKLRELLHKICLVEIRLCSDATKEFVKLLKGETGGDLLRLYFQNSPNFAELLEAWQLRQGKQGLSYIFLLIQTILSHPEGKGRSTDIGRAIDRFGRLLTEEKLDDIYKELNSKEGKQQNAALLLLTSLVRRGPGMASDIAKKFDFKGFSKLAEYKMRGNDKFRKHSTRKAFVGFAISFLEVGKPGLLRSVVQQKEMYSKVLRGLGKDDDETVASVLYTLKDKVLVEESLIPPGLRSVLFGSATLEQLVSISARENGEIVNELAHDVLINVCTDPSNGLMPDAKRKLRGNPNRLLMLMKRLRATEIGYHRDLLLAIVRGRPPLASAFLDEFPFNVEDFASPGWFSSISLAANLVSSVRISCPFDFLNSDRRAPPPSSGSDFQSIMKCICPRPFSRSLITKGMLHSDFLVKHGTLRFLLETLRLLDSFLAAWDLSSSCSVELDVMSEVRSFFPDSQVLLTVLKSMGGFSDTQKLSIKRKAELGNGLEDRKNHLKRCKKDVLEEAGDIIIGGVGSDKDIFLVKDSEKIVDDQMMDQVDAENEYLGIVSEIWASELCSKPIESVEDAEMCFQIKLLDALRIYVRAVHNVLEGSFDVFMKFLSSSSSLPAELQRAVLSLLNEYISWTPKSQSDRVPSRTPPLMYKHLHVFIDLLLFSTHDEVKDLAYDLALVAMSSTGAFDKNPSEIGAWFLFLPGFGNNKLPLKVQEAVQSMSSIIISFLCDAVSTVGNNLFKHWDIIRSSFSHLKVKGVSIGFSPLIVCILQKCVRLLNSESKAYSLPEKSTISLYVCNTLKYLLQTQVDSRLLSCLIQSILSEVIDGPKGSFCEWRPLSLLLFFSQSLSEKKPLCLHSGRKKDLLADSSFASTVDEIKGLVRSISLDEISGIVKAFSSALICATPEAILKIFVPVMAVSWAIYGAPFSFLWSITFSEENFLGNLLELFPDLFGEGSEFLGSWNLHEGTVDSEINFSDHSSIVEEIISRMSSKDIEYSAFSIFLKQAPFPILFTAIMSMDISCLPDFPRIAEVLLDKVLQSKRDRIVSDIRLILFWLFRIRSTYKDQPVLVLCQLSEICLRLMKHLFSQISEPKLVSEPSSNKLVASLANLKQQVAQTVLCHPVVVALLDSPLSCGTLPPVQNGEFCSETLLTTGRLVVSEIDQHILDLLVFTCDHFLFDENHIRQKEELSAKKSIIAFKALVERLFVEFRIKFELCVGTQSYAPLLQAAYSIHALLRFISPFKLLYLARSMLSKIDVEELQSQNSIMILSVGLFIAGGAFDMLMSYTHQSAATRGVYDLLWELEENSYDSNLIEEVYNMACKFSISVGLDLADTCLLKVGGGMFRGKHDRNCSVHPLTLIFSQIVENTPEDLIIHCINRATKKRADILFYLMELSPLHLSVFGHLFFSMRNKKQGESALTDDQLMMLLPAVLSYLTSVFAKFEKTSGRCLDITSVYSHILLNGFCQWRRFLSGPIFEEKCDEILLSRTEDIGRTFNASLLGKAIRMLQYHVALTGSLTKKDDLVKVFHSMFPKSSSGKEMLDYELKEVEGHSVDQMLNVALRVVAKVKLSWICLFPEDSSICHLQGEAGSCVKESSPEEGSNRENLSKPLLNALINSWQCVVKKSTLISDGPIKENSEGTQEKCWYLCKSLENFILRSILELLTNMCEELVDLDSLPFLERLMKSVLLYRFEDSKTLKILRDIFSLLSKGKYSYAPYLQLLISHSQFTPTISSLSISPSHTGELFRPVSSILRHLSITSTNSVVVENCCLKEQGCTKQLDIVKILRVLLCKCGKDSGIDLRELHFLLLCSYGATMSEIDLEIYKLMHDIELIDATHTLNSSETSYLWGKAALKMREGLHFSQDASDVGNDDLVEDVQRSLFRENLCVDPKICALTVLFFPYQRTAEVLNDSNLYDDATSEKCSPVSGDIQRYDPAIILRFSIHSLSMGYIEPVEFASLGLLAVAFASMSSVDLGMRKLGYETLGIFLNALESCRKNKHVTGLRLLLMYVQNGVEEPWQRIPTVSAVFAAEASLILLDSSHEHYVAINKLLKSSSTLKLRGIPLCHDFFWSSAINFRSQRLWELRLLYVGLKSDDDSQIYIRNSILEMVMSFSSSPLADDETKWLILQVVRKSVKFHKIARHLVEKCGMFSWCSSFISMFTTKLTGDEDRRLVVVLEVITDVLSSRNVTEWLQRFALEELMEISSRLYRLLGSGLVSIQENASSVDLILQILSATLKISQKRKMYQPHFTITLEGIFQLFETVANCDSPQAEASAELGLNTILMSTPPVDIICMDVDKLRKFLLWGISTALKSDLKKGPNHSKSHQDSKILIEEPQKETNLAKFLRWLLASVILGKLYSKVNDLDHPTVLRKTNTETLPTLLEYLEKWNLKGGVTKTEHMVGKVILYLQKLLCTNYSVLPSVVCALSFTLLRNGPNIAGSDSDDNYKLIKSLCSKISSPPETIPGWRWSYYQAWKDLSPEPTTDLEKIDELHRCQHLLLILSEILRQKPQESRHMMLHKRLDISNVFEWEKRLIET